MLISLIAAMDKNRLIGNKNQLPWHMPADLAHFKAMTLNKPIVMGRKTFESIGRPLPMRRNVVISTQMQETAGIEVFPSLNAALQALADQSEIMITGGAEIFKQALPLAKKMYVTWIEHEFEGDAYFPVWTDTDWCEVYCEYHVADERNPYPYRFTELLRR